MILEPPVTKKTVSSLKPVKRTEYPVHREDFESEFGIAVSPPTKRRKYYKRSWFIRYSVNGLGSERRRFSLGLCARISFEQAVSLAYVAWAKIQRGEDPQGERNADRAKNSSKAGTTFGEARGLYIASIRDTKKKWRRDEIALERCPKPWQARALRSLKREEIHDWLLEECGRGDEVGRQSRSIISCLFRWAVSTRVVKHHPAQGISLPFKKKPRKQERAFTDVEVGSLYRELIGMAEDPKAMIVLLTHLLGQRAGEVRRMEWEMIDLAPEIPDVDSTGCAWWDLPGDDPERGLLGITKNGHPHRVCLVPEVLELLQPFADGAPKDSAGNPTGPIFPGRDPSRPITMRTIYDITNAIGSRHPDWKRWDPTRTFRRTLISKMHQWNLRRYVIRAMVNHVAEGQESVTEGYNYWMYPTERHQVMMRYYRFILECADISQ